MRLEPLCHVSMRYEESSWHRPYRQAGDRGEGEEALGFGRGAGTVTGDVLGGQLVWANYPRRREDGVWTPNLRGFIRTVGGNELLLSGHVRASTRPARGRCGRFLPGWSSPLRIPRSPG
jgi:hypothetical protein